MLLSILLLHAGFAFGAQHPLSTTTTTTSDLNLSFVFTSLHGLLRQIPNTFSPNGFSIVPATIPAYTNLYHARKDSGDIPKIEWVAFDAEMSYGIMGGRGRETWLHTYVTTRDVKVLVLDGMSAALGRDGSLDSQKVFLYGEVKNDTRWGEPGGPLGDEYQRAKDLCAWAASLGGGEIEGFVRMNTGFEAVWCDFETSPSWELVSKLNVTAPAHDEAKTHDEGPPGYRPPGFGTYPPSGSMPWSNMAGWEWIRSATWHYSLSPESRLIPDLCSFFTFYSPSFASFPNSLTTRKNDTHRLTGVSKSDAEAFRYLIGQKLLTNQPCSGLDWRRVAQDIMDRYGGRIKEMELTLSSNATTNTTQKIKKAGDLAFSGVMPFVEDSKRGGADDRCIRAYTVLIPESVLSTQELLLRDSVEAVLGKICGVFLDVYFEYLTRPGEEAVVKWRRQTAELVAWLDWSMWRKCERGCRWDEVCAISLWPILGFFDGIEWDQPRCVNSSAIERLRWPKGPRYPNPPYGWKPGPAEERVAAAEWVILDS